jgi:hypothetical protein
MLDQDRECPKKNIVDQIINDYKEKNGMSMKNKQMLKDAEAYGAVMAEFIGSFMVELEKKLLQLKSIQEEDPIAEEPTEKSDELTQARKIKKLQKSLKKLWKHIKEVNSLLMDNYGMLSRRVRNLEKVIFQNDTIVYVDDENNRYMTSDGAWHHCTEDGLIIPDYKEVFRNKIESLLSKKEATPDSSNGEQDD